MSRPAQPTPGPLSRRVDVASIGDRSMPFALQASSDELAALAAGCDLPGIDALVADLRVSRDGVDQFRVTGRVTARVRAICVVSLEEFASDLDELVDIRFAPRSYVDAMTAERAARSAPEEDEEDLPDPIDGARIDLGALVAETLVLGLDPYPRKPGIVFMEPGDPPQTRDASPFSVLRSMDGRGKP